MCVLLDALRPGLEQCRTLSRLILPPGRALGCSVMWEAELKALASQPQAGTLWAALGIAPRLVSEQPRCPGLIFLMGDTEAIWGLERRRGQAGAVS
jgi:hypothetical protein